MVRDIFAAFVFAVILTASYTFVPAQNPKPTPVGTPEEVGIGDDSLPVKVKTDLVTLTLTVTDNYGRYISGLKKNAFSVSDNGEPQDITFFSDSDAPVSVGILFDVSGSMNGEKIAKARNALSRFLMTSHPSDEYFLIAFSSRAQLLLDRTRDSDAVLQKLTLVQPKNDTALYDAVYLGIERVTRGAHQKRALLVISDGQDNASRYNFTEVRRLIKEADVVTYAVGIISPHDQSTAVGLQGQAFLDEITSVTGGKAFYPNTDVEMDEIFERIALELRHQYTIGYTPKDFQPDGSWRRVKVKVKPPRGLPRLTVRARDGYYATPNTSYR
ncbi:MAG: VWA domain-containing protein [Chloracidobacterium sp.]|nr:VWA domain-containing protein [Chloracidobacterium sp.]MCC6825992.1 VWA domain-containing protein [Acidobacteriota bacterium]